MTEARTNYAENHPDGAVAVDGVEFHANEVIYYHASADGKSRGERIYRCEVECGWSRKPRDLPDADTGATIVPPFCPSCYKRGVVTGVRRGLL